MEKQTIDKLKYLINKHKTIPEIMEKLDIEEYEVYGLVHILNKQDFPCEVIDDQIVKTKLFLPTVGTTTHIEVPNNEQICFISDIHYASILDRPDIIQKIYEECHRRDISTIICCGDITDGYYPNRKGHEKLLKAVDAKSQIEYVVNTHPYDPNITMYMITGNHDITHFYNEGIMIGEKINAYRKDMVYLGQDEADLEIKKLKIKLYHGKSLHRTMLSSNAEKFLANMKKENKPDILQMGHIHRSFYMRDGKTNVLQTGSLLDQSSYLISRNIDSERTCWFAKIEYDSYGNITSIIPELKDWGPSLVRKKNHFLKK